MDNQNALKRIEVDELNRWIQAVLSNACLEEPAREPLSEQMITSDLLGHRTHGVGLLAMYLERLESGEIRKHSELRELSSRPAAAGWDAQGSVGAWALKEIREKVIKGAKTYGQYSATIARVSHLGNLQAHMLPYVEAGLVVLMTTTTPAVRSVAAPGGATPVTTTNPLAMGVPTNGTPILVDTTTSVASNSYFTSLRKNDEMAPENWLRDGAGCPTRDPKTLVDKVSPGSIESLGAPDASHKGFSLGLISEVFSLGLSGWGRSQGSDVRLSSVFLMACDIEAFGGGAHFMKEMNLLQKSIYESKPAPGGSAPRSPGARALATRTAQLRDGIAYTERDVEQFELISREYNVQSPKFLT